MAVDLNDDARALLDGPNFAVLSTLLPNGQPQTSVIWVKRDGNALLFTTTTGRQKARNIARDGRVSITVIDNANPYHSVEIRGIAELIPDPERRLSYELSHKYLGVDPPADPEGEDRYMVLVEPQRVITFSA